MFICFDSAPHTLDDGAPVVCALPAGHMGEHENDAREKVTGEVFVWFARGNVGCDEAFLELLMNQ